jgi:phosphate acetyltransferase
VVIATMMLALDEVDGLVSGLVHSTANTIRPALQLIKTAPGCTPGVVGVLHAVPGPGAGVWRLRDEPAPQRRRTGRDRPAERRVGRAFGIAPRVAMISYSSDSAASDEEVEKVREATRLAQQPSTTC